MNFRKILLAVAVAGTALAAAAADTAPTATTTAATTTVPLPSADIDGIWAIQSAPVAQQRDAAHFSIRAAQGGLLVIIRLGSYDWQAYVTTLAGNSATVVTITTQAINSWRIEFASAQKATISGIVCIPNGVGIVPLVASPTAGSTATNTATDATAMPIYQGNNCLVPQGATLTLIKVL